MNRISNDIDKFIDILSDLKLIRNELDKILSEINSLSPHTDNGKTINCINAINRFYNPKNKNMNILIF